MKRTWKRCVVGLVVGACCLATVADVDAGIIFRRRPTRNTTYQATTTTRTAAPLAVAPAPTPAPAAGVAATGPVTTGATNTTNRTRSRRLGRRRGTTTNQVTVAPAAVTVRGQTP